MSDDLQDFSYGAPVRGYAPDEEECRLLRIQQYCSPKHQLKNPKGNPHGVTINPPPKTGDESLEQYERRVALAINRAMHGPRLDCRPKPPETSEGTDLPEGMSPICYRWARARRDGSHWLNRGE